MIPLGKILIVIAISSAVLSARSRAHKNETPPNIIFILTDDQPVGYMGFEGNDKVKTPNLDKLAKEGIYFSNAYITSAICTPSRVSIFTGQYERKHGVNFNSGTSLALEAWEHTYPMLLRKAGYYTGYIGKNHTPVGKGGYESGVMEKSFDYWYAGHNHLEFYPKDVHDIFKGAKEDTQVEIIQEGSTDFLSNKHQLEGAIRFLNHRPGNKPFCLSINLNLPHDAGARTMESRESDDEIYKSLYRDAEIPLPPNYIAKADIINPKIPEEVHHFRDRQKGYDYVDNPEDLKERYIRKYQAMTGIDRMLGKLRETLLIQGLDKKTVIIITSDHGQFMGQFGLGGKALCYQVCTNVPMIVYNPYSPERARGKQIDELVQTIDIAPTILSLAGLTIPDEMQGKDISAMLNGRQRPVRDFIFTENLWSTHYGNPRIEAVQDKEWKYIRYYKNENISAREKIRIAHEMGIPVKSMLSIHDPDIAVYRGYIEGSINNEPTVYEELFNLRNDPQETTNLIEDQEYKEVLEKMKVAWWALLKEARGEGPPEVLRYTYETKIQRER